MVFILSTILITGVNIGKVIKTIDDLDKATYTLY